MKCPNCDHEVKNDAKFCTVCGANIEEAMKTKERELQEQQKKEKIKKKEQADKKKLEELRKKEQEKEEQLLKEAEKAEAIRQAKEEGIELEIIDEVPEERKPEEEPKGDEFKVKREEEPKKEKVKKKKVRIKKNIFQVIFEKLLFVIIVAAIICGGLYFCYRNNYLPGWAMEKAEEIDKTVQNIIELKNDIDEIKDGKNPSKDSDEFEWVVNPSIEADDIKDLSDEYSVIIKNNMYGLISNKDGKVVLEPKYSLITNTSYTAAGTEGKGIVVKQEEKFYILGENNELGQEVTLKEEAANKGGFFYCHHDSRVYYNDVNSICKRSTEKTDKRLEICTDIAIVTTTGAESSGTILPEIFTIDFTKSVLGPKGYCDPEAGTLVIDCNFSEALDFSEGYAAVVEDGKAGFINEKGEKIKEFTFEAARSVHDKTAFVKQDGKWGIVKVK